MQPRYGLLVNTVNGRLLNVVVFFLLQLSIILNCLYQQDQEERKKSDLEKLKETHSASLDDLVR